jgi:uncharacterized protein YraI
MQALLRQSLYLLTAALFAFMPATVVASNAPADMRVAASGLDPFKQPQSAVVAPLAQARPNVIVRNDMINLRNAPSTNAGVVGQLARGQLCTITGRDSTNGWWQVQCPGGAVGWVFGQLVDTDGNTGSIPVINVAQAPIVVTPPPAAYYGWRASFFSNRDLAGSPAQVADVGDINFNWGDGSPDRVVPPDFFSTRFERVVNFSPGPYRFTARADDGVRLWIDNQLVIDQWHISSGAIDYTADRVMYGNQALRVEHYEENGGAMLFFSFAPLANNVGSSGSDWEASYFNNPDLAGGPTIVRGEARAPYPLDLDWGMGSPAPGAVNNDNWSARWRGRFFFEQGDYDFRARSDDGVRVYIDGIRIIDAWYDGYKEPVNRFNQIGRGDHEITVEFYERGGTAFNRAWWYRVDSGGGSNPGGGSGSGSGSIRPGRDE